MVTAPSKFSSGSSDIPRAALGIVFKKMKAIVATFFGSVLVLIPQFTTGLGRGVYRLKNHATGEYMYAAEDKYARDADRRKVFCWTKTDDSIDDSANWNFIPIGSRFTIQSVKYKDEYLYAAADDLAYDEERRHVFTWRNQQDDDPHSSWKEWRLTNQPEDCDNCYVIRSRHKNHEFLYAASEDYEYDNERANVFTWRPDTDDYTGRSVWELIPV